ncbi:RrF2 family transcriptional regulator [uncultured Enterovirga sp.]|uniref:RrF2 family transcriptional regulator n=1 Tax=uncultured Enterovirga sp. TaxID=2026352 RepID=UPI0035CB1C4E
MTLLPRRTLYAIAAAIDVALHARPVPVSARALADRLQLGPRHLEAVLQALVRGGILKGVRGPRGGYELARERRRISVGDIVRAVGGDEPDGAGRPGPALLHRVIEPAIDQASAGFLSALDAMTLDDLCREAGPLAAARPADFTI